MAKSLLGIILSNEGIESITFMGDKSEDRDLSLKIYKCVEREIRSLDQAVKNMSQTSNGNYEQNKP